ncbi:response regulator transcription factor [Spirosoma sp. BT702]|uniref:Response regulator transcription factor n=1 Tax=Spirosoma profusum TaxID=2771354 RepID=A0A927AWF9_9BACT|nr:response regulator transcription factor [Spirosoma profusum]MBD2705626.1 response regulator transcription factor [Spirosoma profusum]
MYEDNPAIRDALSMLLGGMPGIEFVGAYPNPLNWRRQLLDKQPDLVLMDIEMPDLDGIEATRAIHAHLPQVNVVMLTVFDEEDKIFRSLCAGAVGYVLKNTTPDRLISAIEDAHAGGAPLSPSIARKAVPKA